MEHQKSRRRLVVDTNFFVGLFCVTDTLHKCASDLAHIIAEQDIIITNLVFSEIVTILSLRQDRALAKEVGNYLLDSDLITITFCDQSIHERAWKIFQKINHKNISYVDCATVALMQTEGINEILTFDNTDFKKLQKYYHFNIFDYAV